MVQTLNLNLNPVMSFYDHCYDPKSVEIRGAMVKKNAENDVRIQELEDIKNFLSQLTADHKEGVDLIDYSSDPEKRALVDTLRDKYKMPITGYHWKGKEIDNLRTICNDEIRTVTTWISPCLAEITGMAQKENRITEILSEIISLYRQSNNTISGNSRPH